MSEINAAPGLGPVIPCPYGGSLCGPRHTQVIRGNESLAVAARLPPTCVTAKGVSKFEIGTSRSRLPHTAEGKGADEEG